MKSNNVARNARQARKEMIPKLVLYICLCFYMEIARGVMQKADLVWHKRRRIGFWRKTG